MSYRWWSCCRTNTGRRRSINEDAFLNLDNIGLWVVADGMGGHARGDMASRFVVEAFAGLVRPQSMDEFSCIVKDRLRQANQRMRDQFSGTGPDQMMGSTVVAFLVYKRELRCIWAGDSRAYLMRNGRLLQITRDHNVAQDMVDRGELRQEEASFHPSANRLTRALGTQNEPSLDEYCSFLRDGDTVLLCSDGLVKEVSNQEVELILENSDCEEASQELVELTLERGARDNVTVAVIRFEATTDFRARMADDTAVNQDLPGRAVQASGNSSVAVGYRNQQYYKQNAGLIKW
jgi:protein phosphatase